MTQVHSQQAPAAKQDTTAPHWREAFHLCVGNTDQILEIVIAHASGAGMLLHNPILMHFCCCLLLKEGLHEDSNAKSGAWLVPCRLLTLRSGSCDKAANLCERAVMSIWIAQQKAKQGC